MTSPPEPPGSRPSVPPSVPWKRFATDGQISGLVLRRFGVKCIAFLSWAALQAAFGLGFWQPLAIMLLAAAMLSLVLGLWHRERLLVSHWNHFDEAVWFLFLGTAAWTFAS